MEINSTDASILGFYCDARQERCGDSQFPVAGPGKGPRLARACAIVFEWSGTRRILQPRVFNTSGRRLSQLDVKRALLTFAGHSGKDQPAWA